MSRMINSIYIISAGIFLVGSFQNCSSTPLEKIPVVLRPFSVKGSVNLCLDKGLNQFTIDNIIIANLNITASHGDLVADSDSDGIADRDEVALGFDPLVRRTNGKILDSLCLDMSGNANCLEQIPSCHSDKNTLGINECDIKTLGLDLLYGHPTQGLDSDKDGIPDILEILRGMSPNINDREADPDHDGVMNWIEIQNGTNPNFSNGAVDPSKVLIYKTTKLLDTGSCMGELWNITVDQLPFVSTKAYLDPLDSVSPLSPSLSHAAEENVITIFLKLKTRSGFMGNSRIYFKDFKINKSFSGFDLFMNDFIEAGEVLP